MSNIDKNFRSPQYSEDAAIRNALAKISLPASNRDLITNVQKALDASGPISDKLYSLRTSLKSLIKGVPAIVNAQAPELLLSYSKVCADEFRADNGAY